MTVPDQTRPAGLSDSQHLAIDVLLTGGTHREAAEAAGVAAFDDGWRPGSGLVDLPELDDHTSLDEDRHVTEIRRALDTTPTGVRLAPLGLQVHLDRHGVFVDQVSDPVDRGLERADDRVVVQDVVVGEHLVLADDTGLEELLAIPHTGQVELDGTVVVADREPEPEPVGQMIGRAGDATAAEGVDVPHGRSDIVLGFIPFGRDLVGRDLVGRGFLDRGFLGGRIAVGGVVRVVGGRVRGCGSVVGRSFGEGRLGRFVGSTTGGELRRTPTEHDPRSERVNRISLPPEC